MPAKMTSTALRRGYKNALICSVGLVAWISLFAFAVSVIFEQTMRDALVIAFGVSWILILALFAFGWLKGKNASGFVLLDCGPHPNRSLFLLNAVLFLIMGAAGGFAFLDGEFDRFRIAGALFGISSSAYWVILAFGRLQIREHGIFQYWSLLKWHKLQSYKWASDTEPTLMIQTNSRLPFLGRGALPVPVELKDAIDELIGQHCVADA